MDSFDFKSYEVCESCLPKTITKSPFTRHGERASDLLGVICSDVCGPMGTLTREGYEYFITFTDDLSRYEYVYLMKHKSKSFEKFKDFRMKYRINLARQLKHLDQIKVANI